MELTKEKLKFALLGGSILGGGGGGSRNMGEELGNFALERGQLELVSIDELEEDSLIVTVSAVGAPAAKDKFTSTDDYVEVIKILESNIGEKISGIITNENGGTATINGWLQAAVLGIPLIDAPCNGRAHPTGTMGSMGLNNVEGFVSHQSYIGGNPNLGNRITGYIGAELAKASTIVRQGAVHAGGLVAVARNVVKASYVKKNGAIGGISHAINLGEQFCNGLELSKESAISNVVSFLNGEIIADGKVNSFELITEGGFDVGKIVLGDIETTFWNEYMTLEINGVRKYTFPDLIMTFDKITGYPITSAEVKEDSEIIIIATKKENIKLGAGMYDMKLLEETESIVNKEIVKYF